MRQYCFPTVLPPPEPAAVLRRGTQASTPAPFLPSLRAHLQLLQYVQAFCEQQTREPSVLTILDVQLALHGLERYFTHLFTRYGLSLPMAHATLSWVADAYGENCLLEDAIHALVIRYEEAQLTARRLSRGRSA